MTEFCLDCKHARLMEEDDLYCGALQFYVMTSDVACELFEDKYTDEQRRFLNLAKQIMKDDHDLLIKLRDA